MSGKNKEEELDLNIKAILIGESGVGKTNLINVTVEKPFNPIETPTNSSCYVVKSFKIDSHVFNLNLWDTAGQEAYRGMIKLFYKNANIVIFVYDITRKGTFQLLKDYWIKETEENLGDKATYAIVGNKNDLFTKEDISEQEVRAFAESKNMKFRLVSAKNDPKIFVNFLEELLKDSKPFLVAKETIKLRNKKKNAHHCKC